MSQPVRTVLAIEDDASLRRLLEVIATRAGFAYLDAADGRAGLRVLHERRPDVVLLDIGLPGLDGWEVLERIRDVSDVPVMLLTARGLEAEKVRGLHAGADDYVTKPFGREELVARIHSLLRRSRSSRDDRPTTYSDGVLTIELDKRLVAIDGHEVRLTPIEYRLLVALVRHAGSVLSPGQLLEEAWDDPTGTGTQRVKFAVMRLRRKLGWGAGDDCPVEAVRGMGYRYRRG